MSSIDLDLIAEFVVESQEGLANIEQQLLAIEAAGDALDIELVNGVFRTMHTIKGSAGFLGLERIGALAHGLEEVLDHLRNREIATSSDLITTILRAADYMKGLIESIETSNEANITEYVAQLQRYVPMKEVPEPASDAPAFSEASAADPPGSLPIDPAQEYTQPDPVAVSSCIESAGVEKSAGGMSDTTIRVDVGLLDKLMTRVGELVLARNQIVQFTGRLEDASFVSTAQRLNLITTELQESVMKTRMQPIGNVWAKFPRVVRDLAGQLRKEVRIEMEGKETELDKTIVEAIKNPLTHLIRNAVDHGVEPPHIRQQCGKPAEGRLVLRAYHEGGQVNIEISDDGAGLNLDRIRRRSIERGLITPDQAARMSDRELSQMIFAAGFSTAEQVTSVSGRGVGMDVVKTNIERIGGVIDLQSSPGAGTTVKIKIPLTLAIIPALIVTAEGDRYAIPQINLLELVRLEGNNAQQGIEYVHGAPVYRLRGKLLPLVYLSERLGLVGGEAIRTRLQSADAAINIVVLRADERQFGLIVDKVNDTEEIVVKPLGKQLKKIGEYAGATIMGDGGVALILDVKGLAVASGLGGELKSRNGADETLDSQRHRQAFQSVLLVDVGDTRRFALPISMVSRLEKIPQAKVEHANGQEVIQYRGQILPLIRLEQIVGPAKTAIPSDELQVVVYDQAGHSFGLVVRRILDTCEVSSEPMSAGPRPPHLLGTSVIQQRVTDVIDLQEIGRRLQPSSLQTSL
jgi:two-component system chemotaxis sensor kinase CheA